MAIAGPNRKPALTAAARKISYSQANTTRLKEESWQERAWLVYDRLPAVFYMTRYRSDIASKIEYFVGMVEDPSEDPTVDEGQGSKVLEAEGGPELLRRLVSEMVVHWDVPGEGYLTRFDEEPFWRVLSTQELRKAGKQFIWGDQDNEQGTIDGDNVYRVWDPHPRFHWQADSPTRHIIDDAEELILIGRESKARSMSRLSAGILWIPENVEVSPYGTDEAGDEDDFARELTTRMSAPLSDAGSAASLVPWVISAHKDDIAGARHMTFDRDWDISLELRRELLRSVATGLDLPPEILTGVADLNHWSAWLVSEMAVSQHVLPTVDAILDSLTTNWFRPLLEASSVDPDLYVLWRDPSAATVPPDQSDVALKAFELGAIGGKAVRRVINMDEEDKPDEEDIANRPAPTPSPTPTPRSEKEPPERDSIAASIDPDFLAALTAAVAERLGGPPLGEAAVTAATRRRIVATELADIDQELLAWLVDETQTEIDRLLGIVEKSLTAATDPLDESLLARFRARVEKKIAQAQQAARQWVERLTGRPTEFADEAQTRFAGLDMIVGGVLEAIRRRLFTPSARPDPIDTGRLPDTLPPTDVLRRGLSVAGGGAPRFDDGATVDMIGNGQRIHDELERNGFRQELMVWRVGAPSHPFDPHQQLSGTEFDSWESPKLDKIIGGEWTRGSRYHPGDHEGCQCSVEQVIVEQLPLSKGPGERLAPGPEAAVHSLDDLKAWADTNGLNLTIGRDISADDLVGIRQAVKAVDDMRARFPILSGTWTAHPIDITVGKRRGLVDFQVGTPGPFGAGASAKDLGGAGQLAIHDLNAGRYLATGRIGQIVSQSVYDGTLHEIGHVMDYTVSLARTDPLKFRAAVRAARREVWGKLNVADDLSNYAASTEGNEFFAEVFAARNSNAIRGRLTPDALSRVDRFARILNEKVHELGIIEDVI